jgi:hypothetical protein
MTNKRRYLGTAHWAGLLTVGFLAFSPNAGAQTSNSGSSGASSGAVQSVIQGTRDEVQQKAPVTTGEGTSQDGAKTPLPNGDEKSHGRPTQDETHEMQKEGSGQ